MLILTRRAGESLFIGDQVTVTVLGFKGNQARIGITAPSDIPVHREEIYNRIQDDKANTPSPILTADQAWAHRELQLTGATND